jgi:hypothetical protein
MSSDRGDLVRMYIGKVFILPGLLIASSRSWLVLAHGHHHQHDGDEPAVSIETREELLAKWDQEVG